ncbi:MAG TPA: ATP-binding protein [Actinospica sp.]|jgi:anti-sigma regulatory factor (Ser/Thr protein kinase)|nr:ATP-binding protein [Actinospica sp.]
MPVIEDCIEAVRRVRFLVRALPESAGHVRKRAEKILRAWECRVDLDTATLLLDELFTNALMHGIAPGTGAAVAIGVDLVETPTGLHVEVHDPDQGTSDKVLRKPTTDDDESGRGLELVEALSAAWGCGRTSAGKFVFFELKRMEPACTPCS